MMEFLSRALLPKEISYWIHIWWTLVNDFTDNEKILSSNDGLMITRNSQKISMLAIDAVKARHRGYYTCHAKNKAGTSKHSAFLHISGDFIIFKCFSKALRRILQFVFIPCSNLLTFLCSVLPQISAFTFGDEELNLDETVGVMCTITKGDLPIDIWWTLLDDYNEAERNLTTNDGVMITKTPKISMLNIEAVKARHRGNYTCFARNKAGIAQHSAYLAINGSLSPI